ncbi:DUF4870 domain-containing protein [bacterium]|nr:DUF4870 domain-containing protein [bacterium]
MSSDSSFQFGPPPDASSPENSSQDDRNLAVLCHVLGFFSWILGPVIIWILLKDKSPFIDFHGKQAINFQITLTIAAMISVVLVCVYIGLLLMLAVVVVEIVYIVIASLKAQQGEYYVIPVAIQFLR